MNYEKEIDEIKLKRIQNMYNDDQGGDYLRATDYLDDLTKNKDNVNFIAIECVLKEAGFNLDFKETEELYKASARKCDGLLLVYKNDKGEAITISTSLKLKVLYYSIDKYSIDSEDMKKYRSL